jgi:hypothetical protein
MDGRYVPRLGRYVRMDGGGASSGSTTLSLTPDGRA